MKNILSKTMLLQALTLVLLIILGACLNIKVNAQTFSEEYTKYVHTYLNDGARGNWTYMEKPVFPVFINTSQLQIGKNWSVVCPLRTNHTYHVYCYGKWVNNGSEPKTDYDIYVYNPLGEMEGYHTESAGLPEHLGTTTDEPFFMPKHSGNYTFVIRNDPRESQGAEQATFMIIENAQTNEWHEHYVEGNDNNSNPVLNTSWAYEFATENKHVEVWIKVPPTLDMYEARLYLMADAKSGNKTVLNGVPLAWEPGLYADRDHAYGGYNLESKEYRGVAYASCEFYGQDMFLNYTSQNNGESLYHLVLIGEAGSGNIEFLVKTDFASACLKPLAIPQRVHPTDGSIVSYVSNSTDLENATLLYSTNAWTNTTAVNMAILNNRTCQATIPRQPAGTTVNYRVEANDTMENTLTAENSYHVKNEVTLNITLIREAVTLGENVTVRGNVTPVAAEILITVYFNSGNSSKRITCYTGADGSFNASFKPDNLGTCEVQARFDGNAYMYESVSQWLTADVKEQSMLMRYSMYIGAGIGAAFIVGAIVFWRKSRA